MRITFRLGSTNNQNLPESVEVTVNVRVLQIQNLEERMSSLCTFYLPPPFFLLQSFFWLLFLPFLIFHVGHLHQDQRMRKRTSKTHLSHPPRTPPALPLVPTCLPSSPVSLPPLHYPLLLPLPLSLPLPRVILLSHSTV